MRTSRKIHIIAYIFSDYLAAILSWIILYFTRRSLLSEPIIINHQIYLNNRFWLGISLIPVGWVILYGIVGSYHNLYKKSILNEYTMTFICSLIGCTVLFFSIVINDPQTDYRYYYKAFFSFVTSQMILTLLGRWIFLSRVKKQLENGTVRFNTLLVGGNVRCAKIYLENYKGLLTTGYHYVGYLSNDLEAIPPVDHGLASLGHIRELETIIDLNEIELVVIALEKSEKEQIEKIIERLSEKDVEIKIIPDILDILSGSVKTSNILGAVFSDIQT
jgi:FlaA1/EpsC-like NDP-sugar epimerase